MPAFYLAQLSKSALQQEVVCNERYVPERFHGIVVMGRWKKLTRSFEVENCKLALLSFVKLVATVCGNAL